MGVHRDDAFHHAVEDGGDLGLLLGEVLDLLAETGGEHVERAPQHADLVGRAHRRAYREVALAQAPRDGLHLDHRPRHSRGDEEADAQGHRQRDHPADEHHLVDALVGGGHFRQGQGEPEDADDPIAFTHRERDIEERHVHRRAGAEVPSHLAAEGRAHLRTVAVVLHGAEPARRRSRLGDDPAVGRDHGDTGARRPRHPVREDLQRGLPRPAAKQAPGFVVERAAHGGEARLEGLHREGSQRVIEVEPGGETGDGGEAHQGQGELERDAAAEEEEERAHAQPSGSSR